MGLPPSGTFKLRRFAFPCQENTNNKKDMQTRNLAGQNPGKSKSHGTQARAWSQTTKQKPAKKKRQKKDMPRKKSRKTHTHTQKQNKLNQKNKRTCQQIKVSMEPRRNTAAFSSTSARDPRRLHWPPGCCPDSGTQDSRWLSVF